MNQNVSVSDELLLAAPAEFRGHMKRTAELAGELFLYLLNEETLVPRLREDPFLKQENLMVLTVACLLHDIGKSVWQEEVYRRRPETKQDWQEIQQHTLYGQRMLINAMRSAPQDAASYRLAAQVARSHHERWDGTGYPDGIPSRQLPLAVRICSIADAYDAMVHRRRYNLQPKSEMLALKEVAACAGTQFDPDLAAAFVALHGSLVPGSCLRAGV